MPPRDYARLHFEWYTDAVLEDCAAEEPAALWIWPVLIAMAKERSHAKDNPAGAFERSAAGIAKAAHVPVDQVRRALAVLEDGELGSTAAGENPRTLRIELAAFDRWQTPRKGAAEREQKRRDASREKNASRDGSVTPSLRSVYGRRDTGEQETEKKVKVKTPLSAAADPAEVKRVFDYWLTVEQATGGMQKATFTEGRKKLIRARLADGFSVQDLQKAIAFFAKDPHHAGINDRSTRYTDLKTTLKNPEKVEAGIHGYDVKHGEVSAPSVQQDELERMGY